MVRYDAKQTAGAVHPSGRGQEGTTTRTSCQAGDHPASSRNDCPQAEAVITRIHVPGSGPGRPRIQPHHVVADEGSSTRTFRSYLRRRAIKATIPGRADQLACRARERPCGFYKTAYRWRNVVERRSPRLCLVCRSTKIRTIPGPRCQPRAPQRSFPQVKQVTLPVPQGDEESPRAVLAEASRLLLKARKKAPALGFRPSGAFTHRLIDCCGSRRCAAPGPPSPRSAAHAPSSAPHRPGP